MPNWTEHVRPRLSSLRLSPAREHEIVQELSQHLEDRWRELVAGGASGEATRLALAEFREGNLLPQYLAPPQQAQTQIYRTATERGMATEIEFLAVGALRSESSTPALASLCA